MKIVCDLDDVIRESKKPFLEYYNNKYGKDYQFDDIWTDDPCDFLKITKKQMFKEYLGFRKYTNGFMNLSLVEGVVDALKKLKEDRHTLGLISSMPNFLQGNTRNYIKRNFGDSFSDIYFMHILNFFKGFFGNYTRQEWKLNKLSDLEADVLIEDSADIAKGASEKGMKVFLFNYPWNIGRLDGVHRVNSWREIVGILDAEGIKN